MEMVEFDHSNARFNMVEQQIRTWDVRDADVLEVLHRIPREEFVPEAYKNLAYSDFAIPVGHGEEMLHPKFQAHALQALQLKAGSTVLEVGTGTGYLTALLAQFAEHVYSIDIHPDLLRVASANLGKLNITNVTLEEGDASRGWPDHGPYDAIAVTGSVPEIYDELKRNMKIGGYMFVIVGESPSMEAVILKRVGENEWSKEKSLFETDVKPLENTGVEPEFEF